MADHVDIRSTDMSVGTKKITTQLLDLSVKDNLY